MPDSKITDLTFVTTPANNDVLPIVDVLNNTTKQIAVSSLGNFLNTTFSSNSANWNNSYTTLTTSSANWSPAGTGTELQFRNAGAFGAVSGTSILGNEIIIGSTETVSALSGANTVSRLRIRNTNAATSVRKQNSPALTWEGQSWSAGLGRSYTMQFRAFVEGSIVGDGGGNFVLEAVRETAPFITRFITCAMTPGASNPSINFNATTYFFQGGNVQVGGTVKIISVGQYSWANSGDVTQATDLTLGRRSAANLLLGGTDAASPIPQTLSLQSVTGSANAAGALFTIDGSRSTGTANGGDIRFRTTKPSVTPSSTLNSLDEVLRIKSTGSILFSPLGANPSSPETGDVYFNSSVNRLRFYDASNSRWNNIYATRTIETFIATENQPVSSNFATLDTRTIDNIPVLNFTASAPNKEARFVGIIPEGTIMSDGLLVKIKFSTRTATTSSCRWGAQIKKVSSLSYATSAAVDVAITGTAGLSLMNGDITLTSTDSLTEGDAYALRILRESSNAADTMADTAQLVSVEVRAIN